MKKFRQYVTEQEDGSSPSPPEMGEDQRDPDKPDRVEDLIASLKEIIQVAKRAMDTRNIGLGDKHGSGDPNKDTTDDGNNVVTRPKSDTPEGLFGQD